MNPSRQERAMDCGDHSSIAESIEPQTFRAAYQAAQRTFVPRLWSGFAWLMLALFSCLPTAGAVDLLEAARVGDATIIRAILKTNAAAVSATNSASESALQLAAAAGSAAAVEALLAAGAPVDAFHRRFTALNYAILYRWLKHSIAEPDATGTPPPEMVRRAFKSYADEPQPNRALQSLRIFLAAGEADPAVIRQEVRVVELLLAAGADPNMPSLEGATPLHFAAAGGSPDTMKLLLAKGGRVQKADRNGSSPIFYAATSGNLENARLLLARGAIADDQNKAGETPLIRSVYLQDQAMAALLLDYGHASINGRAGKLDETPLHAAARLGHEDMVRFLLERMADINAVDKEGYTPLMTAAEEGEMSTVEILAQHGADLTARTREEYCAFSLAAGSTNKLLLEWMAAKLPTLDAKDKVIALQNAALRGRLANVRWLLDRGVPADSANAFGTPLCFAAGGPGFITRVEQQDRTSLRTPSHSAGSVEDYVQIVSLLLTNGAAIGGALPDGSAPLHMAANFGLLPIAEILLEHHADVTARGPIGKTPLHLAAATEVRLVDLLLAKGAVVEVKDDYGFTPLRDAASVGNAAAVKVLLAHGGVVSVRDRYGATPLHWAAMTTNVATVALLLDADADINALDSLANTPLHQAAHAGREDVVKLLLERKANTWRSGCDRQ